MSLLVSVKLWGKEVGKLAYSPNQKEIATFEYNKDFQKIPVEVSPLNVPSNISIHNFDISKKTFHGLPGFIADSLPDKFGNQLIEQYFAKKGISTEEITALDRLLYVGNRSMGALEYEPIETLGDYDSSMKLDLKELSFLSEMLLTNKKDFAKKLKKANTGMAMNLLRIGSSAGGARSKALIAMDKDKNIYDGTIKHNIDCKYYLIKFDNNSNSDRDNQDPKGMTRVEYIYSLIAKKCSINIPDTKYIKIDDDFHFLIERFDRIKVKKENGFKMDKLHYVSWCGMAHASRDTTGAYSYEQLVLTARQLSLGQNEITEIFKRAVFNIIGRNQDDHTKNFGFIMNKKGVWSLSPAFDMTYSFDPSGKWTRVHQIKLNEKQDNFTKNDLISFGKYCNLKLNDIEKIIKNTIQAFKEFEPLATKYNVSKELKNTIIQNLRMNIL